MNGSRRNKKKKTKTKTGENNTVPAAGRWDPNKTHALELLLHNTKCQ